MNVGRQFAAAVSLNDSIFVFGGSDGHNVLRSCEVYNPKLNRWQHISPMQYSRMKHCAVVHTGKVYVVGGVSSNRPGHVLSSVECYIPEENRWTSVCDIPSRRFDHHCYVVKVGHKFISPVMEKPKWSFSFLLPFVSVTCTLTILHPDNIVFQNGNGFYFLPEELDQHRHQNLVFFSLR